MYEKLGAHAGRRGRADGYWFAVWAPNAASVSVVGDFNGWEEGRHPLRPVARSGIWQGFVPRASDGMRYKYRIRPRTGGESFEKADPFAFRTETPPGTASILWAGGHEWRDGEWMRSRHRKNALDAPISIYEVHLGSWRRDPDAPNRLLGYREIAPQLAEYAVRLGFTHVELMPVMEHPFYGSWGYQVTGFFAPTSRYGTPDDFAALVDTLHQAGVGVILDWVPSHFPYDAHGLARFDGTPLYEHADRRQGHHPDWDSLIFNYGRGEVASFLTSSARFWIDLYHVDGLRVDAVASMLYLDYSRPAGEWVPNRFGERENLEAIAWIRRMNEALYRDFPDVQTIAEESTAWPMVSRPTSIGGLGFGMKWDMGWMHDMLGYMSKDPIHRKYHQNLITFRLLYAFHENFVLSLSHDEVVHGKRSLLGRMPGDEWQAFANLRLLYGYMMAQPGKKLLFMGGEFGQRREWAHEESLDWHLLEHPFHRGVQRWVADLNRFYRTIPSLHERDVDPRGFEWIDGSDVDAGVVSFVRLGRDPATPAVAVCNFTPVGRHAYRIGAPEDGTWRVALNSDAADYGGSGAGTQGAVRTEAVPYHGRPCSFVLDLPPLGILLLTRNGCSGAMR